MCAQVFPMDKKQCLVLITFRAHRDEDEHEEKNDDSDEQEQRN